MKNKTVNCGLLTDAHVLVPEIRENFNEHFEVKDASFARGRFAQVRRCVHQLTSAECAAKVMRKYRRAVDVSNEIMHEVRVLLMADKERYIVNLLQLYETKSEYILVLEMAAGGELQRVLDDYDNIPEIETKIMLRQLLEAVCFLHRNNIAHLDIKPQNILLDAPYPVGKVKLCDFGISRLITNDTELREIVGTADYVAPEILHYEPIFLATDMWSIGILTYAMLTGCTPFGGETKQETYLNITQGTLDFPEDLFSDISTSAIDFICKLLKKKPKQRLNCNECLQHQWLVEQSENEFIPQEQMQAEISANESSSPKTTYSESITPTITHNAINDELNKCSETQTSNIIENNDCENLSGQKNLIETNETIDSKSLILNDVQIIVESSDRSSSTSESTLLQCESKLIQCESKLIQCESDDKSNSSKSESDEHDELVSSDDHHSQSICQINAPSTTDQAILNSITTNSAANNEFVSCKNITLLTAN